MANPNHLKVLLEQGREWNDWRTAHPNLEPDLSGADLSNREFAREMNFRFADCSGCSFSGAYVPGASFFSANLTGANLRNLDAIGVDFSSCKASGADFTSALLLSSEFNSADLSHVKFIRARLGQAHLWSTNLQYADLTDADLQRADLMDADLSNATLLRTNLMLSSLLRVDFRGATLSECTVHGASVWRTQIDDSTQQTELIITDPSEPPLRVDDLEVAQFIYLLMNHRKLRNAIDSVTRKGVLLLGRFSDGGLEVLQAIAVELRIRGYLPIIFDFERPKDRSITETVKTLVGMSRFVVVDLSGPSVPQELYATVPHFKVPIVPILEEQKKQYALADDILEFPWVLKPVLRYSSIEQLRADVQERMIEPAEQIILKRQETLNHQDKGGLERA